MPLRTLPDVAGLINEEDLATVRERSRIEDVVADLVWDEERFPDPAGNLASAPSQPFPFNLGLTSFHPMKGPMTTPASR